jgi:hypothetical protein
MFDRSLLTRSRNGREEFRDDRCDILNGRSGRLKGDKIEDSGETQCYPEQVACEASQLYSKALTSNAARLGGHHKAIDDALGDAFVWCGGGATEGSKLEG